MARTKRYPGYIEAHGRGFRVTLTVGGERHRFSVHVESKADAAEWAEAKYKELAQQLKRERDGLPTAPRMSALIAEFRRVVMPTLSAGTQGSYSDSLKVIEPYFVRELGDPSVAKIRAGDVARFLSWRQTHKPKSQRGPDGSLVVTMVSGKTSNRTIAKDRTVLHTLLGKAAEWEYIEANVVARTKAPKADARPYTILSEAEYELLLTECQRDPMLATYVLLLGETGMRCESEALWLRWEDIDLEDGFLTVVSGRNGHRTKTGKTRPVPMTARLVSELRAHVERFRQSEYHGQRSGWVFHHLDDSARQTAGERITSLRRGFAAACRRASLPEEFTQHDLRHRFITRLLAKGHNLALVQKAAGHANVRTTALYTHLVKEDLRVLVVPLVQEAATTGAA